MPFQKAKKTLCRYTYMRKHSTLTCENTHTLTCENTHTLTCENTDTLTCENTHTLTCENTHTCHFKMPKKIMLMYIHAHTHTCIHTFHTHTAGPFKRPKVDTLKVLCRYELHGECKDVNCKDLHIRDFFPPGHPVPQRAHHVPSHRVTTGTVYKYPLRMCVHTITSICFMFLCAPCTLFINYVGSHQLCGFTLCPIH